MHYTKSVAPAKSDSILSNFPLGGFQSFLADANFYCLKTFEDSNFYQ